MFRITGIVLTLLSIGIVPVATADPTSHQYVRTQSGAVRCNVVSGDANGGDPIVNCEYGQGFPQAPAGQNGRHSNQAVVHATGDFLWNDGNLGGTPKDDLVLNYGQTFHVQGWTIVATTDGTRFTNDRTSHGMFVSIESVSHF